MADNRKALIQRVVSGLLAAAGLIALGIYGGALGLSLASTVAILLAIGEYSRMAFRHWPMPAPLAQTMARVYGVICALLYLGLFMHFEQALFLFALANIVFLVAGLWLTRDKVSNENLLPVLAMGCFGLLYCVLFPSFAVQIVRLEHGSQWFFFLMYVVFFGDTFAYFFGRAFGRQKMMSQISPNKTWQGSMGGILGSVVAGMVQLTTVFPNVPWYQGVLFCIFCGAVAQSGDLLVSLIKRVAQVKDSGQIMPGHGGMLDRLDGIFIACPLVYAFALYVTAG